jgi:hypothetical protein
MVPFPMKYAVPEEQRIAQMAIAIQHKQFGRLKARQIHTARRLSIVCYGPTLLDTLKDIPEKQPILSVSGAHDVLLKAGIVPTWHVDCDPRKHKAKFVANPDPRVHYLMASNCHPDAWKYLADQYVDLWHMNNGELTMKWIAENDPDSVSIDVGSAVGLRALHVAGVLGFSQFDIFGMDACFIGDRFRAGPSDAPLQERCEMKTPDGRVWQTTKIMANTIIEYVRARAVFGFTATLHGDSLMKAVCDYIERKEQIEATSWV